MSKTSLEDVRIISRSEKKEKDSFPRARDFSLDGAGENSQDKEKPEGNTWCIVKGFDEVMRILNKPDDGKDGATGNNI